VHQRDEVIVADAGVHSQCSRLSLGNGGRFQQQLHVMGAGGCGTHSGPAATLCCAIPFAAPTSEGGGGVQRRQRARGGGD
jgi:hypothetical protein